MTGSNLAPLRKAVLAALKEESPHVVGPRVGVSAFLLVMFAHGYSNPRKASLVLLETAFLKKGGKMKTVKKAARQAR